MVPGDGDDARPDAVDDPEHGGSRGWKDPMKEEGLRYGHGGVSGNEGSCQSTGGGLMRMCRRPGFFTSSRSSSISRWEFT